MGKDKVEKKEKRSEKKEKRAEKDGISKSKKDKKEKKDKTTLVDAVEKEIASQAAENGAEVAAVNVTEIEVDAMAIDRPVGAVVPFANPLVEDKQAKKVLKSVKKGKFHNCESAKTVLDAIPPFLGMEEGILVLCFMQSSYIDSPASGAMH